LLPGGFAGTDTRAMGIPRPPAFEARLPGVESGSMADPKDNNGKPDPHLERLAEGQLEIRSQLGMLTSLAEKQGEILDRQSQILERHEKILERQGQTLERQGQTLERIDCTLLRMDGRLEQMNDRLELVEHNTRASVGVGRFTQLEDRVARLEAEMARSR
jgi:hypothetical protein